MSLRGMIAEPALQADWHVTGPWIRLGNRTLGLLGVGLLAASMLLSISGAVVTTGTVTVEGNYKTVQHLDGGIVARIAVKDGDRVKEGDLLVKLDDTSARANLAVVVGHINDSLIQEARLEAERDRKPAFEVPTGIDAAEPAVARIVASQRSLFEARRSSHLGEVSVLAERLTQLKSDARGLESQIASSRKQHSITAKELAAVMPLYEKGFVNQQRVGPLQRDAARLEGEIGRLESEIAKGRAAMAEAQLRLAQSEKDYTQQVVDELRKVQAAHAEQEEQRKALADKVTRSEVRAPRSGFVNALAVHTEGGVVTPASPMMQIIPDDDRLVVEAQLPPREIDKVQMGGPAVVRFTAFNARFSPRLSGSVSRISAAQLTDQQGKPYFTAEIIVPATELARLGGSRKLLPGMPAEVFIETERRSILSYFVKPLTDMLAHTFRES